jgi:hypothetical protein
MRNAPGFDPDKLYDQFPPGPEPDQGFARWVRVNDPALFTDEALKDPSVRAFVEAPFTVNYAQFESSTREAEYFIHKPVRAMSGGVEGIEGTVAGLPSGEPRIATLVLNHERSLAIHIHRSITIEDGHVAGQMIHKE